MQVTNADADMLRLAVCKVCHARYGRAENVMTASCIQQVLAVDTKLVTAREGNKLFGLVYNILKMQTQCVHAATYHIRYNTVLVLACVHQGMPVRF